MTILKNPISRRAVMEKSEHVLLIGRGAELFATRQGLEIVDPSYFWTRRPVAAAARTRVGRRGAPANVVGRGAFGSATRPPLRHGSAP